MFIIGIDPHKGSHSAAVIDGDERVVAQLSVCADRRQRDRLLRWAVPFEPRQWAIEGAAGHGALLAQQLVAAGEVVVEVPAALSARARLLGSGRSARPICTMHVRPRSSRCGTVICAWLPARTIARSCACWRAVTTSSSRRVPERSAGCMRCSRR